VDYVHEFEGTHVINPGNFAKGKTFVLMNPTHENENERVMICNAD